MLDEPTALTSSLDRLLGFSLRILRSVRTDLMIRCPNVPATPSSTKHDIATERNQITII